MVCPCLSSPALRPPIQDYERRRLQWRELYPPPRNASLTDRRVAVAPRAFPNAPRACRTVLPPRRDPHRAHSAASRAGVGPHQSGPLACRWTPTPHRRSGPAFRATPAAPLTSTTPPPSVVATQRRRQAPRRSRAGTPRAASWARPGANRASPIAPGPSLARLQASRPAISAVRMTRGALRGAKRPCPSRCAANPAAGKHHPPEWERHQRLP